MENVPQMNVKFVQPPQNKFLTELTILLGSTLSVMVTAAIAPAMPEMSQAFSAVSHADLMAKLILTFPCLMAALTAPFCGWLLDKAGRKPVLMISLIAYALFGTSGYILDSLVLILLCRAFLGVATAGLVTAFFTLIGDYYKEEKLNRMMGLQTAFMGFGGVFFMAGGGMLSDLSWRAPFLVYLASLFILPGVVFFLWEPTVSSQEVNYQQRSPQSSLRLKPILILYLLGFVWMALYYIIPVQIPFFLKSLLDVSSTQVGFALAGTQLMSAFMAINYQTIQKYLDFDAIFSLLFFLMGSGFALLIFAESYPLVVVGLLIEGLGIGLFLPNATIQLIEMSGLENRGRVTSGMVLTIFIGQFASPLLIEPLQQLGFTSLYIAACGILMFLALFYFLKRYCSLCE